MNVIEETIEATLDSNGQLRLTHPPRLPPGPVRVTIRVAAPVGPRRGMADVIEEIDTDQRLRGFQGRTAGNYKSKKWRARPRTMSGIANSKPLVTWPRQRGRECCTTWTP